MDKDFVDNIVDIAHIKKLRPSLQKRIQEAHQEMVEATQKVNYLEKLDALWGEIIESQGHTPMQIAIAEYKEGFKRKRSPIQDALLGILNQSDTPLNTSLIMERLKNEGIKTTEPSLRQMLTNAVKERKIQRVSRGLYISPSAVIRKRSQPDTEGGRLA